MSTEPRPLSGAALARIEGVLGEIARARAADPPAAVRSVVTPAAPHSLRAALAGGDGSPHVIAEVKRASPSQGAIADLDPLATARAYAAAGAAAVSVLTEPHRFGGALAHLEEVAAAVAIPALRKDFVVHPRQIDEARAAGARAVLLIVAVLGDELAPYLSYARQVGLDALIEVHDERELALAIGSGAELIGVNNRDLRTLAIDLATAPRLIALGRASGHAALWIAESGYRHPSEIRALRGVADAVLIGSHFAASGDPGGALRALRGGV
jgi:indole-3-glycerol phosphate synthase